MKRIVSLCVLSVCVVCCGLASGCRSSPHVYAGIDCPSWVETNTPVLVSSSGIQHGAQPMGNVAGPVIDGTFTHGVAGTQRLRGNVAMRGGPCLPPIANDPCDAGSNLTADDWRRITTEINKGQKMPRGE